VCLGIRRVESTPPPVYEVVEIQKLESASFGLRRFSTEKMRDSVSTRIFREHKEGLRDVGFGCSSIPETFS
jgi:hypothetical protein